METNSGPAILLSTAFFAPVAYFSAIAHASSVLLEACESFQKQSYRNRCYIYAPDGAQMLQLPVLHAGSRLIRDIRIDYSKNWQHHLRRAVATAYGPSPFYRYYWDEIDAILDKRHSFMFDLNTELTLCLARMLNLKAGIGFTTDFELSPAGFNDLRGAIHPKKEPPCGSSFKEYYQVFSPKSGFKPNLSVIDLLFNEGPEAGALL